MGRMKKISCELAASLHLKQAPQPPGQVVVVSVLPGQPLQQRVQGVPDRPVGHQAVDLPRQPLLLAAPARADEAVEQHRDADLHEGPVDGLAVIEYSGTFLLSA